MGQAGVSLEAGESEMEVIAASCDIPHPSTFPEFLVWVACLGCYPESTAGDSQCGTFFPSLLRGKERQGMPRLMGASWAPKSW